MSESYPVATADSPHRVAAFPRQSWRRAICALLCMGVVASAGLVVQRSRVAGADAGGTNPWLTRRVLGIAHAGGEDEHPHSTLFGFGEATKDGAPMIDLDLQLTSDGVPVVIHNDTVDRTTNGSGTVTDMTFSQVHALDAAYWYTADCWACTGRPEADYLYRGIRTGVKPPPPGYVAEDFSVPSLEEVFQRFPDAYFDIEIKDDGAEVPELARRTAQLIHEYGLSARTVVASFGQAGMDVFRAEAPDVATSATRDEVTAFILEGTVPLHAQILDVPPVTTYKGAKVTIVTPDFVRKAHDAGLAVWVWMDSSDEQNADFYGKLLDMGVDGINASRPSVLMDLLRSRGVAWDPNAVAPTTLPTSTTTTSRVNPTTVPAPAPNVAPTSPRATAVPGSPDYTG